MEWITNVLLPAVALLGLLSFGSERATEIVKQVERKIVGRFPKLSGLKIRGLGSSILAFGLIYIGMENYGENIDLLKNFESFQGLDLELNPYLNMIIIWAAANGWHSEVMDAK